ncbi:hypothetical protein [Actinomadura sp. 3N407]|uniref:hypothetical protein n=1 Tax=Actinomadura sp. 3N407 TaxID=3457423 RepID=UPI003FCC2A89
MFRRQVEEPAFGDSNGLLRATVCLWRERADSAWRCGEVTVPDDGECDADGAEWLFALLLEETARAYAEFAEEYHELAPALEAVEHVYSLKPLTQEIVTALNPEIRLDDLVGDITEIGYPSDPDVSVAG